MVYVPPRTSVKQTLSWEPRASCLLCKRWLSNNPSGARASEFPRRYGRFVSPQTAFACLRIDLQRPKPRIALGVLGINLCHASIDLCLAHILPPAFNISHRTPIAIYRTDFNDSLLLKTQVREVLLGRIAKRLSFLRRINAT